MRDGNSSLQVALTTLRGGRSGPRTLGVDHRPWQFDGAETAVPAPDRRGEAALSVSCTNWDKWGDAGRGEEMFSVNLGALLVIMVGSVKSATVVQVPALQNHRPLYRNQLFKRQQKLQIEPHCNTHQAS